jgi:ribosomal protein S18 acetylase RimI-like enzyme
MSQRRQSVFADEALAERIERAEAAFMASCSRHVGTRVADVPHFAMAVGGGFATYAGPDSPFNKVSGLGFGRLPRTEDLDAVDEAFAAQQAPVQFEVSSLGDPGLDVLLTTRGCRLVSFENVLGRPLDLTVATSFSLPPGIRVKRGEGQLRAWLDVVVEGVAHPDTDGVAQHESFPRDAVERAETAMVDAGARLYLATRDGVVAGGAGFRIAGGLAQLTGAATAPEHRRRGVQTALVAARLRDAVVAGCDLAVVTTQPGSPSQANMQRMGFDLLYTRAILVRPAPTG